MAQDFDYQQIATSINDGFIVVDMKCCDLSAPAEFLQNYYDSATISFQITMEFVDFGIGKSQSVNAAKHSMYNAYSRMNIQWNYSVGRTNNSYSSLHKGNLWIGLYYSNAMYKYYECVAQIDFIFVVWTQDIWNNNIVFPNPSNSNCVEQTCNGGVSQWKQFNCTVRCCYGWIMLVVTTNICCHLILCMLLFGMTIYIENHKTHSDFILGLYLQIISHPQTHTIPPIIISTLNPTSSPTKPLIKTPTSSSTNTPTYSSSVTSPVLILLIILVMYQLYQAMIVIKDEKHSFPITPTNTDTNNATPQPKSHRMSWLDVMNNRWSFTTSYGLHLNHNQIILTGLDLIH